MSYNSEQMLEVGCKTLREEAAAIAALAENLNEDFLKALAVILESGARVAVSGMGKSGHIARKIAATLSSTGTPAYFLHPAEAGHGDLGMLCNTDVLLAISNSGKTAELNVVLEYAKRHGIPIIGITHVPDSPLGKHADVCLLLPYEHEACPIGCAPTTSTTATLALGDALAMALLKARGFTPRDFNEYHPGGALGKKLLLVRDIMHSGESMPLVSLTDPLQDILLEISSKGFGCTGVVNGDGLLVGMITDGDLRRHIKDGGTMKQVAQEIMTSEPRTVGMDVSASKAMNLMEKCMITSLFVVDNEVPSGIVHMHDCIKKGL